MIQLTFDPKKKIFLCKCTYDDNTYPKSHKFRWDLENKIWYTPLHKIASGLRRFGDEQAKREIDRVCLKVEPWAGRILYPKRKEPYEHQLITARHILSLNRSYGALDPRLGKTPVAAMVVNTLGSRAIYLSPPYLCPTIEEKLRDWTTGGRSVGRYSFPFKGEWPDIVIIPDTVIHKRTTKEFIRVFIERAKWDNRHVMLFIDEAHRFKDLESKRARALFYRISPMFEKLCHLSGTPMQRPMELFGVLSQHAPETIDNMDKHAFGVKFCEAKRDKFGWTYFGASNVEELGRRVKEKFMIRFKKEDVNFDTPTIEEMILLDDKLPPQILELDQKINNEYNTQDRMKDVVTKSPYLATYRRKLGEYKVTPALEYIKGVLEDTHEKILVFGLHKNVIKSLHDGLIDYDPLVITGDVPSNERAEIAKTFQTQKKRRVLLGNIQACSLGLDLFEADRVILVEFSWNPDDNRQAIERAFKVGKTKNVYAQYMVFRDSFDKTVLNSNFKKRKSQQYL